MKIRPIKNRLHVFTRGQRFNQLAGIGMTGLRNTFESFRTQQRHVNSCRGHQQPLVGTDIRGRLGTTDVLFARLQCQGVTDTFITINGPTNNAPRHLPNIGLLATHVTEVRSTAHHRHAQRLAFTTGNISPVSTPGTRRLQQRHRHRVGHSNDQCALRMRPVRQHIHIFEDAEKIGVLDHQCRDIFTFILLQGIGQRVTAFRTVRHFNQFDQLILDYRMRGLTVMRMHRGRHQDPA